MAKKTPVSAQTIGRELNRLRKRVERGEKKTAELKGMVDALEDILDKVIDEN